MTKINDLKPDTHNANRGSARGQKQIVGSIQRNGFGRSGLLDKDGRVIAGNKTLEASAEVFGVEADVVIVESDGTKPVYVKRVDLDLDDPDPNNPARRLAFEDNFSSYFSFNLDPEITMGSMESGFDFEAIGVSLEELGEMLEGGVSELLNGNGQEPKDAPPQIDKAKELQAKWGTELGQVWELGEHRLVIGDCTDPAVVEAVMRGERARFEFSDPPYEMTTKGGGILKTAPRLKDITKKGLDKFDPSSINLLTPTGLFCCNKPLIPRYIQLAGNLKVSWDLCFFTREDTAPNFGGHLMSDTEYLFILGKQSPNPGMEKAIYSKSYIDKSGRDSLVAWAKPIGLVEKFLRLYSRPLDIIIDRFLGSGTTLIACENLRRKCRGIEIDPGYAAVTIQRWADLTTLTPIRVSG